MYDRCPVHFTLSVYPHIVLHLIDQLILYLKSSDPGKFNEIGLNIILTVNITTIIMYVIAHVIIGKRFK
jgi:hypothetical protein